MFLLKEIWPATTIALMVAAVLCSLAFLPGTGRIRGALGAVAMGLAYIAGHFFLIGPVSFPPSDTTNWLPYFALAAVLAGMFCSTATTTAGTRVIFLALLFVVAMRLLLNPKFQYGWSFAEGWIWVAVLASAMVILGQVLDVLTRRSATFFEVQGVLLIICGGTFAGLLLSGSLLLAQLAALLGASVFGTLVLATGRIGLNRGIAPVFVVLTGAILVSGYFFADLPAISALLFAFASAAALIAVRMPGNLLQSGIRMVLVSIPVVIAVLLAFRASPSFE